MGAALAYRDFMVANYSDAGQQAWLAGKGIDLIRGTGTLAGPGVVEVGGRRYTAAHVVLATGSDPVLPPVPGLRELDGVWTMATWTQAPAESKGFLTEIYVAGLKALQTKITAARQLAPAGSP